MWSMECIKLITLTDNHYSKQYLAIFMLYINLLLYAIDFMLYINLMLYAIDFMLYDC